MEENHLPPGFRFHPSDEELITCYLARKVSDDSFMTKVIAVVDLNKCEPWELPAKASMGEKEWYFFNLKDRKYPTGLRTNRATKAGYWKTTGKDKEIIRADNLVLLGTKKTLVFYRGRAPKGEKSNWVMHEYRLQNNHPFTPNKEEWVVCRVFEKNSSPKKTQASTSTLLPSLESPIDETNGITYEYGDDIELANMENFTNNYNMFDNISMHGYNGENNLNLSMNNMCNIGMNNSHPFLPCTPSLLNPNFSMNSLLLKAAILQVRNYQQSEAPCTSKVDYNSFVQQAFNQYVGTDFSSSSTATLDPLLPPLQSQEQQISNKLDPFNW